MKYHSPFWFLLLVACLSCTENNNIFTVEIASNNTSYDTLFMHDIATGEILAKVPLDGIGKAYQFPIQEKTLAEIAVRQNDKTYLTILTPGKRKRIRIDSAYVKTTNDLTDSLENHLWRTTNDMFSKHGNDLFSTANPVIVRKIFDSLIVQRSHRIDEHKLQLSADDFELLHYQNSARVYSFLMFYGRVVQQYTPDNPFFDFIDSIQTESPSLKSLPHTSLYKYEIEYLRENDSIPSLEAFLRYIEQETKTKELEDYLKAFYLKVVIESPSYWQRHEKLFYSDAISDALKRETANKYVHITASASSSFFSSQKGVEAFNFVARKADGSMVKLSDYRGKLVLLDVWATWCGPCIAQKPAIQRLAQKYADHPEVVVLMISVDSSLDRWTRYLANHEVIGTELYIPDGMHTEFGSRYNIRSIPKYILIDPEGVIINSNLMEPSIGMELLIEEHLESASR